jgi:hypothetical protein
LLGFPMRRLRAKRSPAATKLQSIKDVVSDEQLAGIGAVAVAFNHIEDAVDRMLRPGLGLSPEMSLAVISRIDGIAAKVEIAKLAAQDIGLPKDVTTFLSESLGEDGVGLLKRYRDAILQARCFDEPVGKGGKQLKALLAVSALEVCLRHTEALNDELNCLVNIFEQAREPINTGPGNAGKRRLAEAMRDELSSAQHIATIGWWG